MVWSMTCQTMRKYTSGWPHIDGCRVVLARLVSHSLTPYERKKPAIYCHCSALRQNCRSCATFHQPVSSCWCSAQTSLVFLTEYLTTFMVRTRHLVVFARSTCRHSPPLHRSPTTEANQWPTKSLALWPPHRWMNLASSVHINERTSLPEAACRTMQSSPPYVYTLFRASSDPHTAHRPHFPAASTRCSLFSPATVHPLHSELLMWSRRPVWFE